MDEVITLQRLKELCKARDKKAGVWPECKYEARSVLRYILRELGADEQQIDDVSDEWPDGDSVADWRGED